MEWRLNKKKAILTLFILGLVIIIINNNINLNQKVTEFPDIQISEQETEKGKIITVSAPDELNYENVLGYTELSKEAPAKKIHLYHLINNSKQEIQIKKYDKNNNGLIDYIEWTIPHLSEQTYELIIEISRAEHLDENRNFISDIYDEVYKLDDIWSEPINNKEYVRVTFESNLTSNNDITIYPRIVTGNPKIEVYEINGIEKIAEFTSLDSNTYNKVYLTNLISESQDVFDLKVVGGSVEFDYIFDPTSKIWEDCVDFTGWAATNWVDGGTCDSASSTVGSLISPEFSLSGDTSANFTYDYETNNKWDSGTSDILEIAISNDSEVIWYVITSYTDPNLAGTDSFELADYITFTTTCKIRFRHDLGPAETLTVDNINVTSYAPADNTNPEISIAHPSNNTNYSSATQDLNYTFVETNPGFCWYSNDSGAINSTTIAMGTNWTDLKAAEGDDNWTLYCNDTNNNPNSTIVFFRIDSIAPGITIDTPTNLSNLSSDTFDLNYTFVETDGDRCWYSNNSGITNSSYVAIGTNWTDLTGAEGDINRTVYCNDTADNVNSSIVYFTIDTIKPNVNITYPSNNTDYTNTGIPINYTRSDSGTGVDTCWYHNDTNPVNTTLTNCINISGVTWSIATHNVTIWVNDSSNNVNSSYVNFSISLADIIKPNVTINTPENTTYNSNTIIFNVTALDETSMTDGGCWVSIDAGITNLTLLNTTNKDDYNATNTTVPDRGYKALFWCNDTENNINNTETQNFTVDRINPEITIKNPTNLSNLSSATFDLNYTFVEVNAGFCWYSNNSGVANSSKVVMGVNWTDLTGAESDINRTVYCNDTSNQINSSIVFFTIDITYPEMTIKNPVNNTNYSSATQDLNYTFTETNPGFCWYSNNSGIVNSTPISMGTNWTDLNAAEGNDNWTVYCNDSSNNINSTIIFFTIDITYPEMSIKNPVNNTNYSSAVQDLNYTFVEANPGFCWYSNNSGTTNSSTVVIGTNWTDLNATEGNDNWTVYCNDSSNNINSTIIFFTIDITYPTINITYPANTSYEGSTHDLNYTYVETNCDFVWYSNDSGETNSSTQACGTNWTGLSTSAGSTTRTVYINDSANNVNSTNVTFTVVAANTCTKPESENWPITCSDNCTWTEDFTVPDNITITGSGTLTWNANMTFTKAHWEIYKDDGCELVINPGGSIQ